MATTFWSGRRVVVTGHTGFKGAWLCTKLAASGAHVTGLALAPAGAHNLWRDLQLEDAVESKIVDLRDGAAATLALQRAAPDVVFHLAAQALVRRGYREPVETYATNVMGTVNVLEAIRMTSTVRAAVIVTSDKVYADAPIASGYRETARLGGADPYAGSKAAAELVVETYRDAFFSGTRVAGIATARAGNVIGGGDFSDDRLLPDFFRAIEAGRPLAIRRPAARRPWQHVLDSLAGYTRLAEALVADPSTYAEAWNFGPTSSLAVQDVVQRFARAWGTAASCVIDHAAERETDRLEIDASKSRGRLRWESRWDMPTAIERTAHWYRDYLAGASARVLVEADLAAHGDTA